MPQPTPAPSDAAGFAATHWTVVLEAARGAASPCAGEAMAELCRIYWYPLYAYLRRRGFATHEAEDLTQEFFARLLAKDFLATVDRRKGKFRAFLLASLKHFLANQCDHARAQKRGGGQVIIPLDALTAESRYKLEPCHDWTADKVFQRHWAIQVLEQVLARLQAELTASGRQSLFEGLKPFLTGDQSPSRYGPLATDLGMTEGALKVAVHRMRRRYRELLRSAIAQTVSSPEEIDEEIRYLLSCL